MENKTKKNSNFTVYLSSLGSKSYFPDNNHSKFSNVLHKPLLNMNNYEVCLIDCHLAPLVLNNIILVCTDIVVPTFYNEKQMPVLGVYSQKNVKPVYMPLITDTVSVITCSLIDIFEENVPVTESLIVLHFKEKE